MKSGEKLNETKREESEVQMKAIFYFEIRKTIK